MALGEAVLDGQLGGVDVKQNEELPVGNLPIEVVKHDRLVGVLQSIGVERIAGLGQSEGYTLSTLDLVHGGAGLAETCSPCVHNHLNVRAINAGLGDAAIKSATAGVFE